MSTITVAKPNTVIENVTVDRIVVRAPNVIIRNVEVTGAAGLKSNHGLIDFTHAAASGKIVDTKVHSTYSTLWQTGILGHNFVAVRTEVWNVVDGFGIYNTHNKNAPVNVTIDGCHVHDLVYFTGDPNHIDRRTHNDAVQIQGGTHITITNSRLEAIIAKGLGNWNRDPYFPAATGQAIAVTPNVSKVGWLHVEGNYLDGGAQSITLIPGKFGKANVGSVVNNVFGTRQALIRKGAVKARRPAINHPDITVGWKNNTYVSGATAKLITTRNV